MVDKDVVVEMRRQGATVTQIAQHFGVSISNISRMLCRNGFPMRAKKCNAFYTVYLAATDEVVACGTAKECAERLGYANAMSFCSVISQTKAGRHKKYIFVVDKEEADG